LAAVVVFQSLSRRLRLWRKSRAVAIRRSAGEQWTGLDFALHFTGAPGADDIERIEGLVRAWYVVGVAGGYGAAGAGRGVIHFMSDIERHYVKEKFFMKWWVDMGSASELALEILERSIDSLSADGIPVDHLVIGADEGE
jgi:Protein of unknown function (DUF3531)